MNPLTWQNPGQLFVAQDIIKVNIYSVAELRLKKLAATPCDIPVLKQASLFSCLTGLRISDILNLAWDDIQLAPDLGYCVRIRIQKTDTETMLPISDEALQLCGERTEGRVFRGLTRSMVNYPLRKWIAAAGIKKHISFHVSSHNRIIS